MTKLFVYNLNLTMHDNTGPWCRKEDDESEEELESNDGQNTANQVGNIIN